MLAATIFGFLTVGMAGALVYGRVSATKAGDQVRANHLAEEGLEAVRNIRDANFGANFATTLPAGNHGIQQAGNIWTLLAAPSSDNTALSGVTYNRVVAITLAGNFTSVTVTVSWSNGINSGSVSASTKFNNWATTYTSWINAVQQGGLDLAGTTSAGLKVASVGNYAYLVRNAATNNLVILDVTATNPTLVGTFSVTGTPNNIAMSADGNTAYVTTSSTTGELQLVNTTTKNAPAALRTVDLTGTASLGRGIFVVGTTAYVGRSGSGTANNPEFVIVNCANPVTTPPVIVGSLNNASSANFNEVWVSGQYAYVATSQDNGELQVIDIQTNPAIPSLTTTIDMTDGGAATDALAISGYTATTNTKILVLAQGTQAVTYNIATPSTPARLDNTPTTGATVINDVDVDDTGRYAFLADPTSTSEFQVLNMINPASTVISRVVDATGTVALSGVGYNQSRDIVVAAGANTTFESMIFRKN
jgi:hypothetical protein